MAIRFAQRKRVTKAGRGAHAIYLPKAWIDAWGPEQAEAAEVDLLTLDEHLVLSPVYPAAHGHATLDSDDPATLVRLLVSAYVTGHRVFHVHRKAGFSDAQAIEARRALRILDERIELEWSGDILTVTRPTDPAPGRSVASHLHRLVGRVLDTTSCLAELLEFFPNNPDRVIHAAHLVATIEREDVQRLKAQAYRDVARLQLPAAHVADLQLLVLCTHILARMGKLLVESAANLAMYLGVDRDRLHHPPEILLADITDRAKPGPVVRTFLDAARRDLARYATGLEELRDLIGPAAETTAGSAPVRIDGARALGLARRAEAVHTEVVSGMLLQTAKVWGPEFTAEDPGAMFRVVQVHVHIQTLLDETRTLFDRLADFRLAETLEGHDA